MSLPGDQTALWTAGHAADSLVHKQQEVREPRHSSCSGGHHGKGWYSVKGLTGVQTSPDTMHQEMDFRRIPFCHTYTHRCVFVFSPQDGVVDPMDCTLRDFCGRCIEEFVKWSIKQTTPKQQEKSPTNMKSLFKRIYSLALHPNGFKRLGAALAFNSIYRQFR